EYERKLCCKDRACPGIKPTITITIGLSKNQSSTTSLLKHSRHVLSCTRAPQIWQKQSRRLLRSRELVGLWATIVSRGETVFNGVMKPCFSFIASYVLEKSFGRTQGEVQSAA